MHQRLWRSQYNVQQKIRRNGWHQNGQRVIQDKKCKTVERLYTFIDLFIEPEYNVGNILNSLKVVNNTVHIGKRVLEWFGYEGEYKKQRQNFLSMLKNNAICYKELTQKDKEIELHTSIQTEILALPSNVQNSKFLIMEPDDIKMAIMQLKTKNGILKN